MTAQQRKLWIAAERAMFEAQVAKLGACSLAQVIPGIYSDDRVRAAWEGWFYRAETNALSAHNTAQLQKEVERTKGYDAVLAEVGKLQGIVEAGDVENVELQAALEAARNEKAMLLIELQKYHIAERLRSQGAGPPSSLKDWNRCPKCHQEISRGALLHVCLTGLASPPESKP